jgi:hypothetical protein
MMGWCHSPLYRKLVRGLMMDKSKQHNGYIIGKEVAVELEE